MINQSILSRFIKSFLAIFISQLGIALSSGVQIQWTHEFLLPFIGSILYASIRLWETQNVNAVIATLQIPATDVANNNK